MTRKIPTNETTVQVTGLGNLRGVTYDDGVNQFYGIPFARLAKRWTRSVLATNWENGTHDGTKLGYVPRRGLGMMPTFFADRNRHHYPIPRTKNAATDPRVPVKEIPRYVDWKSSETDCLNLNIAVPPKTSRKPGPYPVMVWIHGGAYWFGGNFAPIYDLANLVSHSEKGGTPVVAVSINYRLGIGGFLASRQIKEELANDGFSGVGNFGLTDQQVALEWVQRYIAQFNGDPEDVTIFGESAGGISVAHQIAAARPAKFKRAIQMSGSLNLVANWPLDRHQVRYDKLCRLFGIDPSSPDGLEQLRQIPERDLHEVTLSVEASDFTAYNPCDDGVFHLTKPGLNYGSPLPAWLESIMIGDTTDEGEMWRHVANKHPLGYLVGRMQRFMSTSEAERVLQIYGIGAESCKEDVTQAFVDIIADMVFKVPNYIVAHQSGLARTFAYHIDQISTLDHVLKGQAYHAIDLFYVFMNGREDMSPAQIALGEKMASDWIRFANDKDPWERFALGQRWMIFGPRNEQDSWGLQSEEEDEPVRHYCRWRALLKEGLYQKLWEAAEDIAYERYRLDGTGDEVADLAA